MRSVSNRVAAIRDAAIPLTGAAADYDQLLEFIGDARFVLLGEASHGTEDFYRVRAHITRRLIQEKSFDAVAVEADWPDALRINRFVRGQGADENAISALDDFQRFPLWMWRNHVVVDFIDFLRGHNRSRVPGQRVGFYGLDLYSLYRSIAHVISYLEKVDPPAAARAREFYGCLGDSGSVDGRDYGRAVRIGMQPSCEDAVVRQLVELQNNAGRYQAGDGAEDEQFHAEQNARLVQHAEEYYRGVYCRGINTWNLRDSHMMDTLSALAGHLAKRGQPGKIVVWAHNSHIGDARATSMGARGDHNIGQLVRERHAADAVLVGFTTYDGVVAADDWDGPAREMRVNPALTASYEYLFHESGCGDFMLKLRDSSVGGILNNPASLERAIGVIYRPETELASHYFSSVLGRQFDALIHLDRTSALRPLDAEATRKPGSTPETYPFGV
jgi:erythromycin esterase-like protein